MHFKKKRVYSRSPKNQLRFCEAEGENTYFYATCLKQFLGTGYHRCTRCDNIVNHQQMPVMDDTGVMKHKDGLDILIALPTTLISLTPLETLPPYG